jgi:hypothetical protein
MTRRFFSRPSWTRSSGTDPWISNRNWNRQRKIYNRSIADKAEFNAELIKGHKGVTVVLVPFDPEEGWSRKPVRLHERRHGWLIRGTANGVPFDGYIGERWGRFFIIIDRELREAAGASVGDTLRMVIQPTAAEPTLDRAIAQSKVTTQPRTARADAIEVRRPTRGSNRKME